MSLLLFKPFNKFALLFMMNSVMKRFHGVMQEFLLFAVFAVSPYASIISLSAIIIIKFVDCQLQGDYNNY